MIRLDWAQFKQLIDKHAIRARYIENSLQYELFGADQSLIFTCDVVKGTADEIEFNDYKQAIDDERVGRVTTATEADYFTLKMARLSGTADGSGDLTLEIEIPGLPTEPSRYIAGGYATTDNYAYGDALIEVNVIDGDGNFTGTPGVVLKTYHDESVPTENQGWFFWRSHGTEGEVEIEPIGFYGELYGTMVLQCIFKIQPNAKINAILWWGVKD